MEENLDTIKKVQELVLKFNERAILLFPFKKTMVVGASTSILA
jgi:hypothetical protein